MLQTMHAVLTPAGGQARFAPDFLVVMSATDAAHICCLNMPAPAAGHAKYMPLTPPAHAPPCSSLQVPFRPTTLLRSDTADWWCCRLEVPQEANAGAYAICGVFNGAENWDNNGGADYKLTVANLEGAVVRAVAGACIGADNGTKSRTRTSAAEKMAQQMASPSLAYA